MKQNTKPDLNISNKAGLALILLTLLFILPMGSAEIYKLNEKADIKFLCETTPGSVCDSSYLCNLTLLYPNGTIYSESPATYNLNYFDVVTNLTEIGTWTGIPICCIGDICKQAIWIFEVTESGFEKPQGFEVFIISILFISILIFMVFTITWNLEHLIEKNTSLKDVAISLSFYFTILTFSYLNKLFFMSSSLEDWINVILTWTMYTHVVIPILGFAWNYFFGTLAKFRKGK